MSIIDVILGRPTVEAWVIDKSGKAHIQRKRLETNKIVIAKGGVGNPTKKADVTRNSFIKIPRGINLGWLLGTKEVVLAVQGAGKCVSFTHNPPLTEAPTLTKEDVKEYGELTAINKAGTVHVKQQTPMLMYIVLVINILIIMKLWGFIG